ncbi:Uma2 family endonuclease [Streptomyces sp. NPDC059063]|uniref:Uma2 family endonuclease n=1 Tax=unclassified Streptomyces TaxID=2593676 RepID=UPI0036C1D4D7
MEFDAECDPVSVVRQVAGRIPGMSVEGSFEMFSAVAPEGWHVELIEGEIHVKPPDNGQHEEIISEMTAQMATRAKDRLLRMYTGIGLHLPGPTVPGRVEPDVAVAPKGSFADEDEYHGPAPVLLVAEVTSQSTGDNDRYKKVKGYARAGIPVYLLVDRQAGHVVLYTEPAGEEYEHQETFKLSKVVPLPEPLGFDLDTSQF